MKDDKQLFERQINIYRKYQQRMMMEIQKLVLINLKLM